MVFCTFTVKKEATGPTNRLVTTYLITKRQNPEDQGSLTSLLGVSNGYCQRILVDESEIARTQMGTHNRSENGRNVWGALYDITL
jgi:hypothetical protein